VHVMVKLTFEFAKYKNNENVSLGFRDVALVNVGVTMKTIKKK